MSGMSTAPTERPTAAHQLIVCKVNKIVSLLLHTSQLCKDKLSHKDFQVTLVWDTVLFAAIPITLWRWAVSFGVKEMVDWKKSCQHWHTANHEAPCTVLHLYIYIYTYIHT